MLLSAWRAIVRSPGGAAATNADDGVGAGGEQGECAEPRIGGGDERSGLRSGAPAEVADPFRVDRRAGREHVGRAADGDDVANGRLGRSGEQLGDVGRRR